MYILSQPVIVEQPFVSYVLLQHDFHIHLTVLIASQFILELFTMFGLSFDFLFTFPTQHRTYGSQKFHDHAIHDMVSLHI